MYVGLQFERGRMNPGVQTPKKLWSREPNDTEFEARGIRSGA